MNRLPTLDPHVITIADLKEAGCKDMPKMFRGKKLRLNALKDPMLMLLVVDYYNEGAMDLIT